MARIDLRYQKMIKAGEESIVEKPVEYFLKMVERGWEPLIRRFIFIAELHNLIVHQIKEKFGCLRLHHVADEKSKFEFFKNVYTSDEINLKIGANLRISELEVLSSYICEYCGKYGKSRNDLGWIKTLCEECHEEKLKSLKKKQEEYKQLKLF